MALDLETPFERIATLLGTCDSIQQVIEGEPLTLPAQVCAYICVGQPELTKPRSGNLYTCSCDYLIILGFHVEAELEGPIERKLAVATAELITAFLADRYSGAKPLGGSVDTAELDFSLVSMPEFRPMTGFEYRLFPAVIKTTQQFNV